MDHRQFIGFLEFSDFELASRAGLLKEYAEAVGDQVDPEQQQLIESLTVG